MNTNSQSNVIEGLLNKLGVLSETRCFMATDVVKFLTNDLETLKNLRLLNKKWYEIISKVIENVVHHIFAFHESCYFKITFVNNIVPKNIKSDELLNVISKTDHQFTIDKIEYRNNGIDSILATRKIFRNKELIYNHYIVSNVYYGDNTVKVQKVINNEYVAEIVVSINNKMLKEFIDSIRDGSVNIVKNKDNIDLLYDSYKMLHDIGTKVNIKDEINRIIDAWYAIYISQYNTPVKQR